MLKEIYFLKHYHFSIINCIIILWLKLYKLTHGCSISSRRKLGVQPLAGTREECHKGRTSGKLVKSRPHSCEHWT